jgi:membrane-associated protease RseP (regulator of RpoE activity)
MRTLPALLAGCALAGCALVGCVSGGGAQAQGARTGLPPAPPTTAEVSGTPPAPVVEAPRSAAALGTPGWLGVGLAKRENGEAGVLLREVMRGSPADRAGLENGDVVLSVDGENVARPVELHQLIRSAGAGQRISLGVQRGEQLRLMAVELEGVPTDDEVMKKSFVGMRAPEFGALDTVQGSITLTFSGLFGRVVVVEF